MHAAVTTLAQGNLATHVGDNLDRVYTNRTNLIQSLDLPTTPYWLNQTHSTTAVNLDLPNPNLDGDASFTHQNQTVCAVLTADCLPLLVCDTKGHEIAAIHAGWRGLANGVIDNTIQQLRSAPHDLMVWLGPAIGPKMFEIGPEVRAYFLQQNADYAPAFYQYPHGLFADLYQLAQICLRRLNVTQIYGGEYCAYQNDQLFFSHRRDNGQTGRMASLIWLT